MTTENRSSPGSGGNGEDGSPGAGRAGWRIPGGNKRQVTTPARAHKAEPVPGSFQAAAGGKADLFDLSHYPVRAVCRVCQEPIEAETFLRAFRHAGAGS